MSLWAITMVKDEADVIEPVLRHVAAQGVAGIIVADNQSTDGTREIIERLGESDALDPVTLVLTPDDDPAYYQSAKMTRLADLAYASGARWVWPFDADELWANPARPLAEQIERIENRHPEYPVIQSALYHHFATAVDPTDPETPFERMVYRSGEAAPLGKVIVRWEPGCVIEAGNHSATVPGVELAPIPASHSEIEVKHFPYRSEDQFVSKAVNGYRAYEATDLPWGTGQHWREYGVHYEQGGEAALRRIFREHFFYDLPSAAGLVYDPARLDA